MKRSFKFSWMLIFPWIKFSRNSCSMWEKLGWPQSFLAIYLWAVTFLQYKRILLLICMVLQFMYVKEGVPYTQDLSLENCWFLIMFLTEFTSHSSQFLTSFSSIYHLCFYTVFDSFLSNIDKVLLIDQSANVFSHMVNVPTWIPGCGYHSPDILDLFLLMLVFVLQWLSLHWEILVMLLSQFQLTFHWIQNGMPRFIA